MGGASRDPASREEFWRQLAARAFEASALHFCPRAAGVRAGHHVHEPAERHQISPWAVRPSRAQSGAAYIPDGQLTVDSLPHPITLDYRSATTGPYYRDFYDCVIEFFGPRVFSKATPFHDLCHDLPGPEVPPQGQPPFDDLGPVYKVSESVHVFPAVRSAKRVALDPARPWRRHPGGALQRERVCEACGGRFKDCCNGISGSWCSGTTPRLRRR